MGAVDPAAPVVALVDDLMDRSRLTSMLPGIRFARGAPECAGAAAVVVDLARRGGEVAEVRAVAPGARIVAFGPHVDDDAARRAVRDGADVVLPRSRFFRDPAGALRAGA